VVVCGGMYTASLMFYHKEKWRQVRSGGWDGQVIGLPHLTHFSGNLLFRKCITSEMWRHSISLELYVIRILFFKIGMRSSYTMSGYAMPVTVHSAKKRGWNTFCLDKV
jgi:hypothetical protein